MVTRFQLVGIALACGLGCALIAQKNAPLSIEARSAPVAVPAGDSAPADVAEELPSAADQDTEARVQELTRLQNAKTIRDLAADKMESARKFLQLVYAAPWSTVLTTNWPAFMKLREQAASSPTHESPCTICEGRSRLPYCIVCSGAKGLCVSCRGLGRSSTEEICPTCLGKRTCFLCFGSGEMPCPFCNEGIVDSRQPLPTNFMPIY